MGLVLYMQAFVLSFFHFKAFTALLNWTPCKCSCCVQVLFCYKDYDELTVLRLGEFDNKRMMSIESDIVVDHYKEEKFEDSIPGSLPSDAFQLELSHVPSLPRI